MPWARLAPALLVSVAVHAAAITSLDRYAAPLAGMRAGSQFSQVLTVALVTAEPTQGVADAAAPSEGPGPEGGEINNTPPQGSTLVTAAQGLPLATYFFGRDEVDRPATAISDVPLHYPREAFAAGMHGRVILEVFVDASGSVLRTRVVEAVPHGVFDEAAQEAVGQLRYRPAQRGKVAVRSRRLVQVVFDPNPGLLPSGAAPQTDRLPGAGQAAGTSGDTGE